jgi:tetratricopeptide (TPR) repeat protein
LRIVASTLLLFAVGSVVPAGVAAPVGGGPDKDPQMAKFLQAARHLIDTRDQAAAIQKCNTVIKAFESYYGNSTQKLFCARTSAETLGVLLKAAVDKTNAIALSSTWSDAYFMKGYALQDLHRVNEARLLLQQALKLSPLNSQYLAEIGEVYALEKNWPQAEQAYRDAEENAPLAPEDSRADELGRARRGLGYVLVELGKLDEAEKKYQQCLAANPNDRKAKAELDYVRERKAKSKEQ